MKALLVINVQNGLIEKGDFQKELSAMERVIKGFKENGGPVIFMKHLDDEEQSSLYRGSSGSDLHDSLKIYADCVIEKQTPSSFFQY